MTVLLVLWQLGLEIGSFCDTSFFLKSSLFSGYPNHVLGVSGWPAIPVQFHNAFKISPDYTVYCLLEFSGIFFDLQVTPMGPSNSTCHAKKLPKQPTHHITLLASPTVHCCILFVDKKTNHVSCKKQNSLLIWPNNVWCALLEENNNKASHPPQCILL